MDILQAGAAGRYEGRQAAGRHQVRVAQLKQRTRHFLHPREGNHNNGGAGENESTSEKHRYNFESKFIFQQFSMLQ